MSAARWLDGLPDEEARAALTRCCGATRWVEGMLAARPFGDDARLHTTSDRIWQTTGEADWHEAFTHHPRIGERKLDNPSFDATRHLSRREQRAVTGADEATRRALDEGNAAYEARFGHVFLICASGKSPETILGALAARLENDAATELRIAAAEQAAITHLRLAGLGPTADRETPS